MDNGIYTKRLTLSVCKINGVLSRNQSARGHIAAASSELKYMPAQNIPKVIYCRGLKPSSPPTVLQPDLPFSNFESLMVRR